jgi:hypothetical protein
MHVQPKLYLNTKKKNLRYCKLRAAAERKGTKKERSTLFSRSSPTLRIFLLLFFPPVLFPEARKVLLQSAGGGKRGKFKQKHPSGKKLR